ncbi:MAG: hypothetical protein CM1200mP13_05790 [Candidatus Pelagibacterales bacterium]|nr:MAG: hypothetical protein CM1200mP13_05790 [Pelagibacterales bacterium]
MLRIYNFSFFNYNSFFLKSDPTNLIKLFFFIFLFIIKYLGFVCLGKKFCLFYRNYSIKRFFDYSPCHHLNCENFGTFLIFGLSPAAKVFIILNFKDFFLLRFLGSFELIANPSNAVLFAAG